MPTLKKSYNILIFMYFLKFLRRTSAIKRQVLPSQLGKFCRGNQAVLKNFYGVNRELTLAADNADGR